MRRALILVAVVAITAGACSSGTPASQDDSPPAGGTEVSGSGFTLSVPEGWTSQDVEWRGLVVAKDAADLDADVITGPRLVALANDGSAPEPRVVLGVAEDEAPVFQGDPETATVGETEGIATTFVATLAGNAVVVRQVVVAPEAGVAYTFALEAPQDQWDTAEAELESILQGVRFTP